MTLLMAVIFELYNLRVHLYCLGDYSICNCFLLCRVLFVIVLIYIVFTKGFSFVTALYHNTTQHQQCRYSKAQLCQSSNILHDHVPEILKDVLPFRLEC